MTSRIRGAMKRVLTIVVALTLAGCSADSMQRLPTSPGTITPASPPAQRQLTFVWVVVIDDVAGGGCVRDAAVEVVAGQGLGRRLTQANNCSYWDPDYLALFRDVTPDVAMTLRAWAPGYDALDVTLTPTLGPQRAVTFALSRSQ
jgi:hypothetical protein